MAIGRVQPEQLTVRFYEACREAGFASVNMDLVYGLPHQTVVTFRRTLERVIELSPDRLAVFGYAHVPWARKNQEAIDASALPSGPERFDLYRLAVQTLTDAGYVWIGIDHFARPDDELSRALAEKRLHRNFMGYTTRPAVDLLARRQQLDQRRARPLRAEHHRGRGLRGGGDTRATCPWSRACA